jgi:mono/diheme cytochrome c family protein
MLCISASTACTDSTGTFSGSSLKAQIPATAKPNQGLAEYSQIQESGDSCASCHGAQGLGVPNRGNSLVGCETCKGGFETLQNKIHYSMPEQDWRLCDDTGDCAENTAAYIFCSFNPELAEGCPAPAEAVIPDPPSPLTKMDMLAMGKASYETPAPNFSCMSCHGENGAGSYNLISSEGGCGSCDGTFDVLADYIAASMPPITFGLDPNSCNDTNSSCATDTAAYIFCCFNPGLADGCPVLPEGFCPAPPPSP